MTLNFNVLKLELTVNVVWRGEKRDCVGDFVQIFTDGCKFNRAVYIHRLCELEVL